MALAIHRTGLADKADVAALLAETYPVLLAPDYAPEVLEAALPAMTGAQDMLLTSGSYFIARDPSGAAMGAGGWTREAPGRGTLTPGLGHVRHVVTRLGHTRQGIGRALMAHVLGHAKAAGMTRLETMSTLTAVPFYAACGFVSEERLEITFPSGPVLTAERMTRAL